MRSPFTVIAASIALTGAGCTPAQDVRVYKGTAITVVMSGGNTNTVTSTNSVVTVLPGDLASEWLVLDGQTVYVATASGSALAFAGGQGYEDKYAPGTSSYRLEVKSGTGSLEAKMLSFTLMGDVSRVDAMGMPGTGSYEYQYSGERQ